MKNKHRIKQGLSLLLAGALTFTNVGAALPAFAEDAPATPETASAATPETAEANVPTPNLSQITENLYDDLPDAPTGSYLGSMGLPVATGETKIGISAWVSDLYDGVDAHMDADALNADENTVSIGKTPGTDYAIVPLLAQVEYPADGAVSEIILPDDVELLSYLSTDYEPIPADEQEQAEILHQTYSEQSAAATGLYVKASANFTAQLVYIVDLNCNNAFLQIRVAYVRVGMMDNIDRLDGMCHDKYLLIFDLRFSGESHRLLRLIKCRRFYTGCATMHTGTGQEIPAFSGFRRPVFSSRRKQVMQPLS